MSSPNEKFVDVDDAILAFRSIARIAGDVLNNPLDVASAELAWSIMFMADTMADKLDGVTS